MICITLILLLVSILLNLSDGVKVNMQGSVSLGKEVVDTLSYHIQQKSLDGRRSGDTTEDKTDDEEDVISLIVNSAFLCRNVNFCEDDTNTLINDYIITLTKAVENIFVNLINELNKNPEKQGKTIIFEDELRGLLHDIKKILKNADTKINERNAEYTWINLIKKISAKFQAQAEMFAGQRLEGKAQELNEVKKKLTHKLVIATSLIELKFEGKLCSEYNICYETYEATNALYALLNRMQTVPVERAKEFIKHFSEALTGTNFYFRITDITGNEFKSILHDMAYAENILTKNVLAIVQKCVESRLNAIKSKFSNLDIENSGRDTMLVHAILSDMDHFYGKQKKEQFKDFFHEFYEWANIGGIIITPLRRVMKDIQNMLYSKSEDLVMKLINEVRVFMEITVDPDT